ncbi:MAG: plastocyanin/azurin family copper-binding protein, partial [Gemmatimonadales bacterium]
GFMRARCTPLLLLAGALTTLGCGGDDGGNNGPPASTISIAKIAGDEQQGVVGQVLLEPLVVTVTDGDVASVGSTVTWSATGGGSVDPASDVTDASGNASTTWTLGTTSGPQTARATLSGAIGSPLTFTAVASPGDAASLEEAGGNDQSATVGTAFAEPVQVKVTDEFGNGVPDVLVGWTATGGTVSAASVPSDAAGISAVNATAGAAPGAMAILATAEGLSGSPVTFSATVSAAPPPSANVSVVNSEFQPSALTISAGTTVTWTWPAGSTNHNVVPVGTEPASSGNPANGPKTYQFTFNTPGTYVYFCTVHGSPAGGMRGTVTVQ